MSFLIVFLLYCCYQPLRFSIADRDRQARYASVFAIVAGAFVPLNFVAVRLADSFTHPRVLTTTGGGPAGRDARHLPGVPRRDDAPVRDALEARADSKNADEQLRSACAAARAGAELAGPRPSRPTPEPALPLGEAGAYVAAAYLVFVSLVLVYVVIIGVEGGAHGARAAAPE